MMMNINQQYSEAIRLNNAGASLLSSGTRHRESSACFAKSLGMIKALMLQQTQYENNNDELSSRTMGRRQQSIDDPDGSSSSSSDDAPLVLKSDNSNNLCTHQSELSSTSSSSASSPLTQQDEEQQQQRRVIMQFHETLSSSHMPQMQHERVEEDESFLTYQNAILLQAGTADDYCANTLTRDSACVIFNMALLYHRGGSLQKAEQLYRLTIQILKEHLSTNFTTTNSEESCTAILDGTRLLIMLAAMNNLSYLLFFSWPEAAVAGKDDRQHHRFHEASETIRLMSGLLRMSGDDMLCNGIVTKAEWSNFILNACFMRDRRLCQSAAAA